MAMEKTHIVGPGKLFSHIITAPLIGNSKWYKILQKYKIPVKPNIKHILPDAIPTTKNNPDGFRRPP